MGSEAKAYKAHCLVVPYPTQGHINPMLQFSKRLEHNGIKVTVALTDFICKTMNEVSSSIAIEKISDGKQEEDEPDMKAYFSRFQQVGSQTLTVLIEKLHGLGFPVDGIVYDAFMPWALDIAKKFGLVGATFLTQSCSVSNIYYDVHCGTLKLPLTGSNILVHGLPPLEPSEMPSFIYLHGSYPGAVEMFANQFSNVDKADCVLVNSFYMLEKEVADWMGKLLPLLTIGPTIPSMYLDQQIEDDKDYGLNIYYPNTGPCIKWLNERPNGSVVYVSFGSLAKLVIKQMEELAWGLKGSNKYFLWVVRASEETKLPQNFLEETSEQGLVVSWCPQLQVLANKAIGCFVTHCGWNSTLEAFALGVPMIAMPQWTDQSTNAKLVMDVWGNGLRARTDEEGIVRREEVEHCIREIMGGDKAQEIKGNAAKWSELAREAVEEGGSSDKNIDEFVAKLVRA